MQVSRYVYSTEANGQAIKDQICLSQSLMRVQIEIGPQPGWGTNQAIKASRGILCIVLDFKKIFMLIYVSYETPEQITDHFYFKLRSLFLHGSVYSR